MSTAVLLLWYVLLGPLYQISATLKNDQAGGESLSVLSFNVREFNKHGWISNPELENQIVSLIQNKTPDVLCFQEFSEDKKKLFAEFPYQYQTPAYNGRTLQVIFSKYPILNSGSLDFPNTFNNALYVDIRFKGDTLRLYNIHLQSFSIVPEVYTLAQKQSSKLLARFRAVLLKQGKQAELIRKNMEQTQHHKIVVGDFNNTPYSSVYKTIRGNMQDSFFEKGKGFGQTYALWGLPIRIDYIFADPALEILSHENFSQKLSDHYPLIATLRISNPQEKP